MTDVVRIGPATLYLGDCMEILHQLGDQSLDLVLSDLPYGSTRAKWDKRLPLDQLWGHYQRICSGPIVLFADDRFELALRNAATVPYRYWWVWEKSNATGHLNAPREPMQACEVALVFGERQPTYNPIKTTGHPRKTATKRKDVTQVYGKQNFDQPVVYDSTERYPRNVLKFASDKQKSKLHGAQKPLALCEYLIRTHSNPGDLVLDNCMGSASIGLAALNTGRRFIGIEKDPDIFNIAVERIGAAQQEARAVA